MKLAAAAMAALLIPSLGWAQQKVVCNLVNSRQTYSVGQGAVTYIGGPVFECTNGSRITADSAVNVASTGRTDFMGNVKFTEPQRSLASQYAQYNTSQRLLTAQGNVVLTDKANGSTLRAPSLDYFQKGGVNPDDKVEIYSGRPHATLVRKRADSTSVMDTTNVDADAMTLIGQQLFRGKGHVDVKRGKLTTSSGFAEFAQDSNYMHLYDHAIVQSDTFRLSADSIDADMVNGQTFKTVHARKDAKLHSDQADIAAPRILINFDSGQVSRMVAVGGSRVAKNLPQANTVSKDFTLTADSIDALSPQQKLDHVIAVGNAYAARAPDSLDAILPEIISKDWVRGDTVKAFFGQSQKDTTRVLERLVANGAPAASTYKFHQKVQGAGKDSTQLTVNYLSARHIDVTFKDGAVDQVHAEGDIRGMYLQPPKAEQKTAAKPQKASARK